MLSVDSVWKNSLFNYPYPGCRDRTKMKIGGYGSIATSSAVAAVRKPNRRGVHIDMERVQDSAGGPARDAGSPFRGLSKDIL